MPEPAVYHVVPQEDRWAVKREGSQQATRVEDDREDAVRQASGFVRNAGAGRVVVHGDNGAIEKVHTYDQLPAPPSPLEGLLAWPVLAGFGLALLAVLVGWISRDR